MSPRSIMALLLVIFSAVLASMVVVSYYVDVGYLYDASAQSDQMIMSVGKIAIQDQSGKTISGVKMGQSALLAFELKNSADFDQNYIALLQASSMDGYSYHLVSHKGILSSNMSETIAFSWKPRDVGTYELEIFLWTSLENPEPLAEPSRSALRVMM